MRERGTFLPSTPMAMEHGEIHLRENTPGLRAR
jgi:hypothetical protein